VGAAECGDQLKGKEVGLYEQRILPLLTHWAMGQQQLVAYRQQVVGGARGRVLEIGIGSGRNLPFYGEDVEEVIGVDPSPELLAMARRALAASPLRAELYEGSAEQLPFNDRSFDAAVVTWSLCSIPDPAAALWEARRVLRPGGRLLFAEHGRAPDPGVQRWQDRLTPAWRRWAGGCHLNRKPDDLVRAADFTLERLDTGYARGPRPMAFIYEGSARA
jgi:ubiquinone/menaquinone biosynthesis C-methylase UbiE